MRTFLILTAAVLMLGACGGATLRPGRALSSELPRVTHSLRELWPGGAETLFAAGYPVRSDWYAAEYLLHEGDAVSVEVSSSAFTPVLVVIDDAGRVLAVNDSRGGGNDARVDLAAVPEGARLLLFALDDRRGPFSISTTSLTPEQAARTAEPPSLSIGPNPGWIPVGRAYAEMDRRLDECFGDMVYAGDFESARIHPFEVPTEGLVTLEVRDAAFDAVMVLASLGTNRYEYLTYQDDTIDMLPRISRYLLPGKYVAVVMGYSESDGGAYALEYDFLDTGSLVAEETEAAGPGVEVRGEIAGGRNLAISFWPELADGPFTESPLEAADPTGAFAFEVTEPDVYTIDAAADFDVCLTLLRNAPEGRVFTGYNDDGGGDLGTDSRLSTFLQAGRYTALVSPYFEGDQGSVFLTWSASGHPVPILQSGRSVEIDLTFSSPEAYLSFEMTPGRSYEISAVSGTLDSTIEAYLPDGTTMFDDDSGGDLNSRLTITPAEGQAGTCILRIRDYWGDQEGGITVSLQSR